MAIFNELSKFLSCVTTIVTEPDFVSRAIRYFAEVEDKLWAGKTVVNKGVRLTSGSLVRK